MVSGTPAYCPTCATALTRREFDGRERAYCPDCERYVFRNPAPCAGVLVCDCGVDDDAGAVAGDTDRTDRDDARPVRVLLVQRDVPPGEGEWTVPGGHLEYDEPPAVAAARELREETNLRVEPADLTLLDTQLLEPTAAHPDPEKYVVSIGFVADWRDVSGEPRAGSDAHAVGWFSQEALSAVTLRPQADRRTGQVFDGR